MNSMLHVRHAGGAPSCAAPGGLRHAHFSSRLLHGGPSVPDEDRLRSTRAHHATASGGAASKLRALDAFLDAWLEASNRSRAELGLDAEERWDGSVQTEVRVDAHVQ